jgi:hypothetical protein
MGETVTLVKETTDAMTATLGSESKGWVNFDAFIADRDTWGTAATYKLFLSTSPHLRR